jgi:hypothetical protein
MLEGEVTTVTNKIHTKFFIYDAINRVIFPTNILIPTSMDVMNIVIGFLSYHVPSCGPSMQSIL